MPAPLDIDREQVRMLVVSVGCSEAARQTGINLNTILQWSSRFGWLRALKEERQLPPSMKQPVIGVIPPAIAQLNALRDKVLETRENHVEVALTASKALRKRKGASLISKNGSQAMLAVVKSAALVGGWDAGTNADNAGKAFGKRGHVIEVDADSSVILQELDSQECSTAETGQIGSDNQS